MQQSSFIEDAGVLFLGRTRVHLHHLCVCQNKWQLSSSEATWKLECTCILIFVCFSVMIILILRNQEGCLSGPASFLLISLQDLWLPMSWGEAPLICFELQVTYIFYQYHCTQAWGSIEQLEAQKLSWFHSVLVKLATHAVAWGTGVPSTTAEIPGPPVSGNCSDFFSCKMLRARPSSAAWICMRWTRYAYGMHWIEILASLQSDRDCTEPQGKIKPNFASHPTWGRGTHTIPYAKMLHSQILRVVQRSTVLYVSVRRKGPKPCPENIRMPCHPMCSGI